jgi:hypothetical protein
MKNNTLVFLGFALICLMNMNPRHHVVPRPAMQPVASSSHPMVVSVPAPTPVTLSPAELAVIPKQEAKKPVSVSAPVVIHKLRDRESEAIDAPEVEAKDDKLAPPL